MRQVNIVGKSPPSQPSRKIETLQAPPDIAPANITLRTASETSLWLRWVVSCHGSLLVGPHSAWVSSAEFQKVIIVFRYACLGCPCSASDYRNVSAAGVRMAFACVVS